MRKKSMKVAGCTVLAIVILSLLLISACITPVTEETEYPTPTPPDRDMDAFVSTDWLEANMVHPGVVILDIRAPDFYNEGHIPGAINVPPEGNWYTNPPFGEQEPWMEVPAKPDLFATIGSAGISGDSEVVIVGRTSGPMPDYAIAGATRVADTLLYAGVEDVAILNGGFDKWANEGKEVSKEVCEPQPLQYKSDVNEEMFASKAYVESVMGDATIVDARDANVYFGAAVEPWATRPGHIPGATSLPAPWVWGYKTNEEGEKLYGTFKDDQVLKEMAVDVVKGTSQEIIVYCGVGGYASTVWYVLHEVVGYEDVKIFDGSAQEWAADPDAPLVKYAWE
ncbi:MAG: sulfurtransferase [Dehalococcoidia bacterium]